MLPSLSWLLKLLPGFSFVYLFEFSFSFYPRSPLVSDHRSLQFPVPRLLVSPSAKLPTQLFLHGSQDFADPVSTPGTSLTPTISPPGPTVPRPSSRTLSGTFVTARSAVRYIRTCKFIKRLRAYSHSPCVLGDFWVSPAVHKNTFSIFVKP